MALAFSVDIRRITVQPGAREEIHFVGNTFSVLTAAVGGNTDPAFRLGINDGSTVPFAKGLRYRMPDGETYSRLVLENPTGAAAALVAEILIALGDISDERLTMAGSVVASITSLPAVTIAAGQSVGITGTPNVAVTSLPAVTIAGTPNMNATITGTPNVNATIAPGQAVTLTGSPMVSRENLWATFAADMSVGTTPFKLVDAYAAYRELIIQNVSFNAVRVAGTSSVSPSFGLELQPRQTLSIAHRGELWACTRAGIAKLSVVYVRI